MKKIVVSILLIMCVGVSSTVSLFAHSSSQSGILETNYIENPKYSGYFIGSEDIGWIIDESHHSYGIVTYCIDSTVPVSLRDDIDAAVSAWNSKLMVFEKRTSSAMGTIVAGYYDISNPENNFVAQYGCISRNSSTGHVTSWIIQLNLTYISLIDSKEIAHELGHVIGLCDLYASKNTNKLMYGTSNRTVSTPQTIDVLGASVIWGSHSQHDWGYKYHSTVSGQNRHEKYCTYCKGETGVVSACSYSANGRCTGCGIPEGYQANMIPSVPEVQDE